MSSRSTRSYWMVFAAESILLMLSVALGSAAFAQYSPYTVCGPTTAPVTSGDGQECPCLSGEGHNDRCIGTKPKIGNWYGNVACMGSGSGCTTSSAGQNECGIIMMCPYLTCGTEITELQCACENFQHKTPCFNHKWGLCVLSGYDPNPDGEWPPRT